MLSETEFRWKYILNKEELLVLKGKRKMTAKMNPRLRQREVWMSLILLRKE